MSHDRGCPCGREFYEYRECPESNCYKREKRVAVAGVYIIRCKVNGRSYVGSSVDADRRIREHKRNLSSGTHPNRFLQRSWNALGEECFVFSILEQFSSPIDDEELRTREQNWIDELKTMIPGGYNLAPVAGSMLGYKFTEDQIQKLRNSHNKPQVVEILSKKAKRQHEDGNLGRATWSTDHAQNLREFGIANSGRMKSMNDMKTKRRQLFMEIVEKGSDSNSAQVGGSHYKGRNVNHWDVISLFDIGYLEGNSTKYVFRHRSKHGLQDIEKAGHYLDKLIEMASLGMRPRGRAPKYAIKMLAREHSMPSRESCFIELLCRWRDIKDLFAARELLELIREEYS